MTREGDQDPAGRRARRRRSRPRPGRATVPADAAAVDGVDPADRRAEETSDFAVEAPGVDEVSVVPWPLMVRQRVQARVERSDRYPWLVLSAALFGLFSVGFSITVLTIAIPNIAEDFDTTRSTLIWLVTGPILLGAIVTPAAGKLADLLGARRVYLTSMLLVAAFAALSAVSWSAPSLLFFRIIGAAIGSATGPASIAIINRLFPRERRAQALGYWSLVAAGGPVLGVVIGGPVVELVSWRWIFVAQVPLTLATVAVCAAVFPDTQRVRNVRFDALGALLLAGGSAAFVIALNRAPGRDGMGWTHPLVLAGFIATPVLLSLFVLHERRIDHQLIPMRYFTERNFSFPMVNQFFTNFAYMGGFFLTPFLLRDVLHWSETEISFVSIARPFAFAVAGPVAGWLATRIGERTNGVVGGLVIFASMLAFSRVTTSSGELLVIFALVLSGVGMGTAAPAMAASVANAVKEGDLGVAGGAQQMISQIGVVVGTQVMVTVQEISISNGSTPADSYRLGYLVGGAGALLAALAALGVRSSRRMATDRGDQPGRDESSAARPTVGAAAPDLARAG